MKRIVSLILVLVLCLGLCACASAPAPKESLSDRAAKAVQLHVQTYLFFAYEFPGSPRFSTKNVTEVSSNVFQVYGTVTLSNNYGSSFSINYEGTATYDAVNDDFDVDYDVKD